MHYPALSWSSNRLLICFSFPSKIHIPYNSSSDLKCKPDHVTLCLKNLLITFTHIESTIQTAHRSCKSLTDWYHLPFQSHLPLLSFHHTTVILVFWPFFNHITLVLTFFHVLCYLSAMLFSIIFTFLLFKF